MYYKLSRELFSPNKFYSKYYLNDFNVMHNILIVTPNYISDGIITINRIALCEEQRKLNSKQLKTLLDLNTNPIVEPDNYILKRLPELNLIDVPSQSFFEAFKTNTFKKCKNLIAQIFRTESFNYDILINKLYVDYFNINEVYFYIDNPLQYSRILTKDCLLSIFTIKGDY